MIVNEDEYDEDPIMILSYLAEYNVVKFDSGASRCMTGDPNHLVNEKPMSNTIRIVGFNNTGSSVTTVGVNADGKEEYYVSDMPSHLTLLCANAYCQDGCAVLFANDGVVLRMTAAELEGLKEFLKSYPVQKVLRVNNRTYEVDPVASAAQFPQEVEQAHTVITLEEALNGTATRFFNTKVNVSNQEERILTLLMTGLTYRDLYKHVKHGSLQGMPKDLTLHGMEKFEYRYGRTPSILTLANPRQVRDATGLRDSPKELTHVGQRIEIDVMFSDYNVRESVPGPAGSAPTLRTKKLATHGGATAAALCVDGYSSFVHGKLLKSVANPEDFVEHFFVRFQLDNHQVQGLAADQGIITNSMFEVSTPAVDLLCKQYKVGKVERSEPYNHSRVTGRAEIEIQLVKKLIRLAITLILRNPNFPVLGFTPLSVYKLWGKFFLWATVVINLKPSPVDKSKTRWEVYHGTVPNMQEIRLLPIGCILIVIRVPATERQGGAVVSGGVIVNEKYGQVGIYVGPSLITPGAARVAVMSNGKLKIIVTTNFQSGSDGGGLNIYPHVERGLKSLLEEQIANGDVTEVEEDPESQDACEHFGNTQTELGEPVRETSKSMKRRQKQKQKKERSRQERVDINQVCDGSEPIQSHESTAPPDISSTTSEPTASTLASTVTATVEEYVPSTLDDHTKTDTSTSEPTNLKRSARIRERRDRKQEFGGVATDHVELETCCFADWSTHIADNIYWSWTDFCFYAVKVTPSPSDEYIEEGYRAVTEDVPKSFKWGDPARKEFDTIISTKAMVKVNPEVAREAISRSNADLMYLFPVYEEKVKEGKLVYKVRLVADGRTQYNAGETYSATPSREELLVLMHIIAALDWDYAHIDEVRAFLKAPHVSKNRAFVKFRGGKDYYEVLNALYGLKTAPRAYQEEVARRLETLGFTRLVMCSCIYIMRRDNDVVIIFDYVDDFIFTGNKRELTESIINQFREICETTPPEWDAERMLGMEFRRDRVKRVVMITMQSKIEDVCKKFDVDTKVEKYMPMPQSGYIVKDYEFDALEDAHMASYLDKEGMSQYMAVVGALIWVSGLRMDVLFCTMYLAWSTQAPREHHKKMAMYILSYLYTTRDLPLVLGGLGDLGVITYTDASLGTAPKGRSVVASVTKLNEHAGAVSAHTKATSVVFTSSFEAELDGTTRGIKDNSRICNIIEELRLQLQSVPRIWSDNLAMVKFMQGEGVAKGVRHMELRMWYCRERFKEGNKTIDWMTGEEIPSDKLTKLGTREQHEKFTRQILGLDLLN